MPYAWFNSTHILRGATVPLIANLVLRISLLFYLKSTSFSEVAIKDLSAYCEIRKDFERWTPGGEYHRNY